MVWVWMFAQSQMIQQTPASQPIFFVNYCRLNLFLVSTVPRYKITRACTCVVKAEGNTVQFSTYWAAHLQKGLPYPYQYVYIPTYISYLAFAIHALTHPTNRAAKPPNQQSQKTVPKPNHHHYETILYRLSIRLPAVVVRSPLLFSARLSSSSFIFLAIVFILSSMTLPGIFMADY